MKTFAFLLAGLCIATMGRSQTAGNWSFTNTLSGTAGSSLTVSAISLGSAITTGSFNSGTEYYGENGWPSGALDPNAYLQFSLSAATGHYLVLNTINLVMRRSNTGSPAGAGPNQWSLRSSLDNYSADLASGSITYNYVTYPVTLPAAFQAIPSSVTFRVYGYNATVNAGGISRFVYDNISVQGQSVSGVLAEQSIDLSARSAGQGNIALQWQTDGFAAGTEFTLQRSTDGTDFTPIQQLGSTPNTTRYQYEDANAPSAANLFYRVSAVLPGGGTVNSPIVAIRQGGAKQTQIRGVVAQGASIKTWLHLEEAGAYQLSIWSSDGKALLQQTINGYTGDAVADLSFGAHPHGVYILTLSGDGQHTARQFVF
ncbi:MAG TPA: hypothetical protein VL832_11010 [Puia sp.]|nr:hypothetical protein [Puia sp.]